MKEILASILGVVVGALVTWLTQRYYRRLDVIYMLHAEFLAERMSKVRDDVFRLVPEIHGVPFPVLGTRIEDSARLNCLWELLGFYHRVAILTRNKEVRMDLVPDLFGDTFVWWYTNLFQDQLKKTEWAVEDDIHWLWAWMSKHEYERGVDYRARWQRWNGRAERELAVILKKKS